MDGLRCHMNDFQASVLRGLDWGRAGAGCCSARAAGAYLHHAPRVRARHDGAYRLGDDTAKRAGRLSLNPIKHIDVRRPRHARGSSASAGPSPCRSICTTSGDATPRHGPDRGGGAGREPRDMHRRPLSSTGCSSSRSPGGTSGAWYVLDAGLRDGVPEPHARALQHHPHPAAGREQGAVLRRVRAALTGGSCTTSATACSRC